MMKLIVDADATIKLAKAGVLSKLCFIDIIMPQTVYDEIMKGKDKMYQDTSIVEELVKNKKIKIIKTRDRPRAGFGKGEVAVMHAFHTNCADVVMSDDRKFIGQLEKDNIPFMLSTDTIAYLVLKKKITTKEGRGALEKIRKHVREENYQRAKETIGGC